MFYPICFLKESRFSPRRIVHTGVRVKLTCFSQSKILLMTRNQEIRLWGNLLGYSCHGSVSTILSSSQFKPNAPHRRHLDTMEYAPMDTSQIFGMVSYLHILAAFAVILQLLLEDVLIPDNVLHEMVVQSRWLWPHSTRKFRRRIQNQDPLNPPKRLRIQHDYIFTEDSVLSDWLGEVPHFPDKQFKRTFRIKHHMLDMIINHLAKKDSFWIKTVCRAGKETINPYV